MSWFGSRKWNIAMSIAPKNVQRLAKPGWNTVAAPARKSNDRPGLRPAVARAPPRWQASTSESSGGTSQPPSWKM